MTTHLHAPMPPGASRAGTLHVARAMAYDFILNSRRFAIAFLLTPLLPLFLYGLMLRNGEITAQDVRFFFFMALLGESFACTFFIGALQCAIRPENLIGGVSPRFFTLPISTSRLVLNLLAQGIALSILLHCYNAICFRLVTGVLPPIVGPAFFLSLLYAGTMAVIWALPDFVLLKLLALVGCIAPLGIWVFSVYEPQVAPAGQGLWRQVGFRDLFWMPLALAAACGVAVAGVRRDRRGDARGGPDWGEALVQMLLDRLPRRHRPFASPDAAQFWLEWRQKGRLMPIMSLALVLVELVLLPFWPREVMAFMVFSSCVGLLLVSIPFGFMIGHCNFSPQRSDLDLLRATRPLSDRALASTVLRCGLGSLLLSWLIALAGVAVASFLVSSWGRGELLARNYDAVVRGFGLAMGWRLWAVPLDYLVCLPAAWTALSLFSLAMMSGRSRLIAVLLTAFVLLGVAYGILQASLPDHLRNLLTGFILLMLGAGSFLWTLLSFYEAGRRRLITPAFRRFGIDLCLLALVAVTWFLRKAEIIYILLAAGLLCLPLLPLALAPLALSGNRHR